MAPCDSIRESLKEDLCPRVMLGFYDRIARETCTELCIVLERGRLLVDACDELLWPESYCWEVHANLSSLGKRDHRQLAGGAFARLYPELCRSVPELMADWSVRWDAWHAGGEQGEEP